MLDAKNHAAAKGSAKRKSRSPSPPIFGPTEMLQRERLKRLRKENGCVPAERVNGVKAVAERGSARKSINPRRLSVSKVELTAVVERAKRQEEEEECEDGKRAVGKQANGTAAAEPRDGTAVKRPKIDFEMEESEEEDEEENEGLKKLMDDIDDDLRGVPMERMKTIKLEKQSEDEDVDVEAEEEEEVKGKNCFASGWQAETRRTRPNAEVKKEVDETDCGKEVKKEKEEEKGGADNAGVLHVVDSHEASKNDEDRKPLENDGEFTKESGPSLADETIASDSAAEAEEEEIPVEKAKEANGGKEEEESRSRAVEEKGKEEEEENEKLVLGDSSEDERGVGEKEKSKTSKEGEKGSTKEAALADEERDEGDKVSPAEDGGEARSDAAQEKEEKKSGEKAAEEKVRSEEDATEEKAEEPIEEAARAAVEAEPAKGTEAAAGELLKALRRGFDESGISSAKVKIEGEGERGTKRRKTEENGDAVIFDSEPKGEPAPEEEAKPRTEECKMEDGDGKDKDRDKVYRLTKSELEMLVINKVTEFFSESNKSELGALRNRCEQLEKYLEQWRRKAQFYQKQMADMQNLVQRARRFALPQRPSMRSVGLQVQLTRYIPADPSKLVSRVAQMGVPVSKPQMMTGQPQMLVPKQVSASQLAFVTNLGPQGTLAGATLLNKNGMPQLSNVGMTATVNTMLTSRPQTSSFSVPTRTAGGIGQLHGGQMGVSLLHPRGSTVPGSYIIGPSQSPAAVVKAPGSGPLLRTTLDATKAPSAAVGTPVPTCLVQNQALTSGQPAASQAATTRTASVSLIGQPTVVTSGVKLIDLTADEEDAKAQQAAAAAAAAALSSASTTAAGLPTAMAMMPATLCAGNNTMTVLTPSSVSGVPTGQLLALGSAIVSSAGTLSSATPLRVTAPIRGQGNAIVNNGAVRLTYLMPTSSMMTMVRPNQPVFVTPSSGIRPGPTNVPRQGLPTIVLQRGTTLVPLQQGQMTTLPTVRPGSIISSPTRTISTASGPLTLVGPPSVNRPITTLATSAAGTGLASYGLTSGASNAMLNVPVAKTVTTPTLMLKHPAPLPIQPTQLPLSAGRKAVPPKPALKISKVSNGIVLSWNMCLTSSHSDIVSYQLYAYQEGAAPPSTALWKKVGDVKALPLPMACTLTQFMEGHKYYFAVRAVDTFGRIGPFSDPGSIALVAAAAPVGKPTPVALKS